jgi:hypothetical protein
MEVGTSVSPWESAPRGVTSVGRFHSNICLEFLKFWPADREAFLVVQTEKRSLLYKLHPVRIGNYNLPKFRYLPNAATGLASFLSQQGRRTPPNRHHKCDQEMER